MIRGSLGRVALVTLVLGGLGAGACTTPPPVAPPAVAVPPPPVTAAPPTPPVTGTPPPRAAPLPTTPSKKVSPPSPTAAPPRVLAPQLSAAEEERLRQKASARIESAEQLVKHLGERQLGQSEQDTFGTIRSLLDRARVAFAEANLKEAYNLADKAQVLATELSRSTR